MAPWLDRRVGPGVWRSWDPRARDLIFHFGVRETRAGLAFSRRSEEEPNDPSSRCVRGGKDYRPHRCRSRPGQCPCSCWRQQRLRLGSWQRTGLRALGRLFEVSAIVLVVRRPWLILGDGARKRKKESPLRASKCVFRHVISIFRTLFTVTTPPSTQSSQFLSIYWS